MSFLWNLERGESVGLELQRCRSYGTWNWRNFVRWELQRCRCVFRGLSDTDSDFCRTVFRFWPDSVPIDIGQCSGLRSESFWVSLEWCPSWPGMVSERDRKPEPGGVEGRWNKCPGSRSMRLNGRLMA